MSNTEVLLVLASIFILLDVFFVSDFPTVVAYILIIFAIVKNFDFNFLYQVLFGLVLLFFLIAFHYFVWRKFIEKINDKFISPRKHIGGYQSLIGEKGIIKNIEGTLVITIGEEIFLFESSSEVKEGEVYIIRDIKSSKLII